MIPEFRLHETSDKSIDCIGTMSLLVHTKEYSRSAYAGVLHYTQRLKHRGRLTPPQ